MTVFLLKNPDCVFIHIHKTGGTSIRRGVWRDRNGGRAPGHMPHEWRDRFAFAFMRDPISRFMSVYRMFTQGTLNNPGFELVQNPRKMTVSAFFDIVRDDGILYDDRRVSMAERIRHHAIPQTHPYNCLRHAHFIGRYENLAEDFARVSRHLGIDARLPRLNVTAPRPKRPGTALKPRLRAALKQFYADDYRFLEREIEAFRTLE